MRMIRRLLQTIVLIAATPLMSALVCYDCVGSFVAGQRFNINCLREDTMSTSRCNPAQGEVAKCSVKKTDISPFGVRMVHATRQCVSVLPESVTDMCRKAEFMETCYCSTDHCNEQTTHAPALTTLLFGLFMAILREI